MSHILSSEAVNQFWRDFQDPFIYRVIAFMESKEEWTVDGDAKLEEAMASLSQSLDGLGNIELDCKDDLVTIAAGVKTGRGLRMLMALDMAHPGAAARILMHAEEQTRSDSDMPGMFLRRNVVFERLRLLGRIFAKDRIEFLNKALEEG